jgi:regulator of extracellular matrix RemA (YlzA/DUF370 family)
MRQDGLARHFVSIGFGNVVSVQRVIAVLTTGSSPMKRLKDEAKDRGLLIDATEGRRTRSIIVMDSGHIVLSGLQSETITNRLSGENEKQ